MHLPRGQVDVVPAFVRNQETETVLVTDNAPGNQVELVRQGIAASAVADQLAIPDHGIETPAQGLGALLVPDNQQFLQVLAAYRPVGLGNDIKDVLATGDRLFVALGFTARMGVARMRRSGAGFLSSFHSDWLDQI
jgi:hypothetical protein